MSLGKRLESIENLQNIHNDGVLHGVSYFEAHVKGGGSTGILYVSDFDVFTNYDLKTELLNERGRSMLIILDASIIEGLDLRDSSVTLSCHPTFKIHYAALHKNLLAIHALYFGRIYTYDEKADAFHTWHLERIERGWSLLTMSEEIKPDWIVLDECDCMSRHLQGVYKIARFTDACWWKGSAYEAKDQRRQDKHKATHYKQQQREADERYEYNYNTKRSESEWDKFWKEREAESHSYTGNGTHQQTYAPPTLDNKPGSILWAYATLGLERGQCSFTDAKRARKVLMKQYHPDLAGDTAANLEKAQEINWAFDILQGVLA